MEKLIENVKKEFKVLRIDLTLTDEDIDYYLQETKQSILNKINSYKLPRELNHVLVKRTVGAIIELISTSGTLVINNEKIEDKNLKSITRGDVSMSYDGTSSISKTTELLNKFQNYGDSEILKFRIIRW